MKSWGLFGPPEFFGLEGRRPEERFAEAMAEAKREWHSDPVRSSVIRLLRGGEVLGIRAVFRKEAIDDTLQAEVHVGDSRIRVREYRRVSGFTFNGKEVSHFSLYDLYLAFMEKRDAGVPIDYLREGLSPFIPYDPNRLGAGLFPRHVDHPWNDGAVLLANLIHLIMDTKVRIPLLSKPMGGRTIIFSDCPPRENLLGADAYMQMDESSLIFLFDRKTGKVLDRAPSEDAASFFNYVLDRATMETVLAVMNSSISSPMVKRGLR